MDAYANDGLSNLIEVEDAAIPAPAKSWLDQDRELLGSDSPYSPDLTRYFQLRVDGLDSYMIEAQDAYSRHVEIFDGSGQHIASGSSESEGNLTWKSSS